MNITHAVPSMGESSGGPPRSVGQLCDRLSESVDIHILTAEDQEDLIVPLHQAAKTHFVAGENRTMMGRLRASGFFKALDRVNRDSPISICHQHGIWLRCSHETTAFAASRNVPLVVAPRGMMEPWAINNSKWKKKLAWALYQKRDLEKVAAFHATAQSEAESIRSLGFKQPIAVIPNGIVLPEISEMRDRRWQIEKGGCDDPPSIINHQSSTRTALFLSRVNPKKGLTVLLDAWANVAPSNWRLVIAGNDDSNHLPVVEQKIQELGLSDPVEIAGPLFGEAQEAAYRNADLFVLPSYSENFGIVVAEALGYGIPVLTTTGCPWQELESDNCGWWVEPTLEGIQRGLSDALGTTNEELSAMGARGRALVEQKYQWPGIAERMLEFYEWILNGGQQPEFVV